MERKEFELKYGIGIHNAVMLYNESCARSSSRKGLLQAILAASPEIDFCELVMDVVTVCGLEGLKLNVPLPMENLPAKITYKPIPQRTLPLGKMQSMRDLVLDDVFAYGSRKAAGGVLFSNGKAIATNMMAMVVTMYRDEKMTKYEGKIINPASGREISASSSSFPDYTKAIRKGREISENYLTGFLLSHLNAIEILFGNIAGMKAFVKINVGGKQFVLVVKDFVACIRALEAFGSSKIAFCPIEDRLILMGNKSDFAVLIDIIGVPANRVINLDFDIQCRLLSSGAEKAPTTKVASTEKKVNASCNGYIILRSWNIASWNYFELKVDDIEIGIKKTSTASFLGFYMLSMGEVAYFSVEIDENTQSVLIHDLTFNMEGAITVIEEANKRLTQRKRQGTARKCFAWMHENLHIESLLEQQAYFTKESKDVLMDNFAFLFGA